MDKIPRLTKRQAINILTLLLCSGSLTLWAQQENQEPIEPDPLDQREAQNAGNTPSTTPEKTDAGNTPATTPKETNAGDSPFDYKSSEKISEDLSVSFPVDI